MKTLSFFPKPNQAGTPITQTNNWFDAGINLSSGHQMNFKGDHNINDKSRHQRPLQLCNSGLGTPVEPVWRGRSCLHLQRRSERRAARTRWSLNSPRRRAQALLWSFRYGLTYSSYYRNSFGSGFDLTTLGLPKYMLDNATLQSLPDDSAGWLYGYRNGRLGDHGPPGSRASRSPASVNKIMGGHNMKFGGGTPQQLARLRAARLPFRNVHVLARHHLQGPLHLPEQ